MNCEYVWHHLFLAVRWRWRWTWGRGPGRSVCWAALADWCPGESSPHRWRSESLWGRQTDSENKEMFYLTMHSTHFIYGYMVSDIWLRTILIVRKETRCRHIGYSFRLAARVLLYAPSHRQDSTYHGLCYTSHGALAQWEQGTKWKPFKNKIGHDKIRIY